MTSEPGKGVLLIVDDEALKRVSLQIELSEAGYTVFEAAGAVQGMEHLAAHPVDVVITDLRMPEMDGIQFLEQIKANSPRTHVIVMTAYATVETAVQAIKRGAYDYITKPFATDLLLQKLNRLHAAGPWLNEQCSLANTEMVAGWIGRSYASQRLCEQIRLAAQDSRTVLVEGEKGTETERVAEMIHQSSARAGSTFVVVQCDAGGGPAVESEIFGTDGNGEAKASRLEMANDGTLLLVNVDALSATSQARLLRVLENGVLERSGGRRVPINARIICTTSKRLSSLQAKGVFREDLYYKLAAMTISVPALRDRREDIPLIVDQFVRARQPSSVPLEPNAMDALVGFDWPGNTRELEHVLERAITLSAGQPIHLKDVLLPQVVSISAPALAAGPNSLTCLTDTVSSVERTMIDAALRRAAGNQAKAAQYLGIPRTTLRDKMAKYGMVGAAAQRTDVP